MSLPVEKVTLSLKYLMIDFWQLKKLVEEIGDMMNVQLIIEGSMNSSNPYFSSSWRRNLDVR